MTQDDWFADGGSSEITPVVRRDLDIMAVEYLGQIEADPRNWTTGINRMVSLRHVLQSDTEARVAVRRAGDIRADNVARAHGEVERHLTGLHDNEPVIIIIRVP